MGRGQELLQLHELLGQAERVAIAAVGMGGIGKTTLARRYVQQHRADYPGGIWWVAVDELVAQVLEYASQSVGLEDLSASLSEAQIVQHYLARWEAQWPGRKLLVLDDVGEYKAVKGFLSRQGAFQVLMTTRVQMQRPVACLRLEVLEPSAALSLLRQLMEDDERLEADASAAAALCEWLGYLPLGIELVGRYLAETSGSVTAILARLKAQALAARAVATVADEMDYGLNVQAAIDLSWQVLDKPARQVAMVVGLFALAPVKAEWVAAALPGWGEEDLQECLDRQLVKRSLLNREVAAEGGRYQLHSLVRAFLQGKWVESDWAGQAMELQQGFAQAMTAVAKTIQPVVTVTERERVTDALPHLEVVAAWWTERLEEDDKTWCCTGLARFYQSSNLWVGAERCHLRALEISKAELGDSQRDGKADRHPSTATSLNNLAALYDSQGRYGEAEPLFIEALEIRKAELGDRHPSTATSLNNLAALYDSQGRYGEAEPLHIEALEISKAELGDRHPSTATSLNNLAALYDSQVRYGEAEPLHIEALEIRKAELGDRHPSTATSLNNLALLYDSQGRYGEAEPLYIEALEIWKAELGDRHPNTATSLFNLAALYYNTQRHPQGLTLIQQALDIYIPVLGPDHPTTQNAMGWRKTIQQALTQQ